MVSIASTVEAAMRAVDEYATPTRMSQEQALEFYQALAADIEARIDGLKSDLRDST